MCSFLTGYVGAFNRRQHRVGHLFQNRYRSIVVEEEPYLLELVRYIHLNPVRALRQAGTPTAADARILGCGEFVARLLTAADAKTRDTLRICRPQPPLDALA